jgi:enoyl-CoA hydratase/carnithine racemase
MSERVRVTSEGALAFVTLNRPDKHNGVDGAMLRAVVKAQRSVRKLPGVRAVILNGEGSSFCAGLDFKAVLSDPLTMTRFYMQLWTPRRSNLFQAFSMGFRELGVPVIAAIHGNCFGAGLQLALGADIRIATPDAKLSVMEAKWGLVPDMGGPTLLRELVRIDVAKELAMTGRVLSGTEAHALGLVSHLSEDPVAHARRLAEELSARSPDSVAAAKLLMQDAWCGGESEALSSERRWQRRILGFANQRISIERNQKKTDKPFAERRIG